MYAHPYCLLAQYTVPINVYCMLSSVLLKNHVAASRSVSFNWLTVILQNCPIVLCKIASVMPQLTVALSNASNGMSRICNIVQKRMKHRAQCSKVPNRMCINAKHIRLSLLDCRANVLYGVLSLVNHSCCPNSTYYILDEAVVLRSGQDLAPGKNYPPRPV